MIAGHTELIAKFISLAKNNALSHGYLFAGPEMIGKKLVATSLANFLESGKFEKPRILQDCFFVSPDANGSIGIDASRELKQFLWQKPAISRRRTAIIDDAHLLTAEAQNALLKITEEPPQSSLIILITHDPEALTPTLSSRLQRESFAPVEEKSVRAWAKKRFEGKTIEASLRRGKGKPGLVVALLSDERFLKLLKEAEWLLAAPKASRSAEIKKFLERKDFDFAKLLDALILVTSWEVLEAGPAAKIWHRLLELRHDLGYFNLNPRLQLESLFYNTLNYETSQIH